MRQPGLILGSNYIETLVLTFEQFLLHSNDLDTQEYIVLRLEELVCSIGLYMPFIVNSYHSKILSIIQSMYSDIPYPELNYCYAYNTLLKWAMDNTKEILGTESNIVPVDQAQEKLKQQIIRITRTAILSTLMEAGFIKTK